MRPAPAHAITYGRKLQQAVLESARGRSAGERIKPWLRLRPRDFKPSVPAITEPSTGLSMGEHTELMAKEWGIGRPEQDELANASHVKAAAAWKEGFFDDLVVPFGGLKIDNNLRADSTVEKLGRLQPSFDRSVAGTLTAGNSTPLTDGASSVLVASEDWAKQRGLPVQAYLTCSAVGIGGILPHEARPQGGARPHRPGEAQSQRQQPRCRPSLRRYRDADCGNPRETACPARFGPRPRFRLHCRRDGRDRDPRALRLIS